MRGALTLRSAGRSLTVLTIGAIILRLALFLGRGEFVAFDEGWYLLLGRSIWEGGGYSLSGLRHATLSPLFPILAGGISLLLGDPVWAGRIVAAVAGGLLVLPCWSIFNRLAGGRTALLGCLIVAVSPSLAPFTVPYWVGWDLWMGPEPLYHLFLYTGIAIALRAYDSGRILDWGLAGAAFALAYLARPESIVVGGLLGLALLGTAAIRPHLKSLVYPAVFALAFGLVATPYWLYLHDTLGRWTITGRHIEAPSVKRAVPLGSAGARGAGASIERMLWQGDQDDYARVLYGLHPSGVRMASTYWGVPAGGVDSTVMVPASVVEPAVQSQSETAGSSPAASEGGADKELTEAKTAGVLPGRLMMYARALGIVAPAFIWPFILCGIMAHRRRGRGRELFIALPIALASPLIAGAVAVDPRTQLFLAPLLAFYAARGIRFLGVLFDIRIQWFPIRRGLVSTTLALGVVTLLLAGSAHRLYASIREGSPHHTIGFENRRIGEELRDQVPVGNPIMSWDPAIALYAQRDWRVLPYGSLPEIVRYASAIGCEFVVLSRLYPAPPLVQQVPANHLLLHIPPSTSLDGSWRVELTGRGERLVVGRVIAD